MLYYNDSCGCLQIVMHVYSCLYNYFDVHLPYMLDIILNKVKLKIFARITVHISTAPSS